MKLSLSELKILESELRVVDPTANRDDLSEKQQNKMLSAYEKLVNKLTDEILRRENKKKENNTDELPDIVGPIYLSGLGNNGKLRENIIPYMSEE